MMRAVTIMALYLAGVGAAAQISKIIPVFTVLQSRFDTDLAGITLVMSTIGVASIVAGMAAGFLVGRIGHRRSMFAACLLSATIGLVLPIVPGIVPMVGLRLVESIGHLGIVTAAPALMASLTPQRYRPVVLGLWATFFGVAFAFSQHLASVVDVSGDVVAFLRLHVLLFLPALAVLAVSRAPASPVAEAGAVAATRLLPSLQATPQLFVSLSFLFHAGVFTSLLSFTHIALEQQFGVAPDAARTLAAMYPLLALAAMFATGLALGRVSSLKLLIAGASGLLCALAILQAAPAYATGASCSAFLAIGVVQSCLFARISNVADSAHDVAIVNGMFSQLGNLGNLLVPFVFAKTFAVLPATGFILVLGPAVVSVVLMQITAERFLQRRWQRGGLA